ncbi:TonB-dependent receptor [Sneathia vaginalis]|uniref:TonB-dependent receptor n=1 Tax=Sneathia vaginalis TaxID=187101 RepID=UPI0035C74537
MKELIKKAEEENKTEEEKSKLKQNMQTILDQFKTSIGKKEEEKKKIEENIKKIDTELEPINKKIKENEGIIRKEGTKHEENSPEAKQLRQAVADAQTAINANDAKITEKTAAKNEIEVYKDNGGIDLEGDLSYKTEGAVFGVNSVLNVPFSNTYIKGNVEFTKDFATLIKSTHTAYFGVSDVLSGGLSVQHSYKGEDAMKYVSAKLDGKYAVSNDLDLVGKFRFKYQFNGEIDFKNEYLGNKDLLTFANPSPLTYIHMYSLGLNYRKTLNITGFVGHGYEKTKKLNYLNYGLMADVKYTGIDKLTLKANATLSGLNVGNKYIGLFEFGANAKYDFNATDKFTVSPELDANVKFKTKEKVEDVKFVVTPKVSVKYVPVNGLTLSGSVGVPVTVMNSAYESTSIKTNLNIRYEW